MTDFFDALETRSPDQREAAQMAALPGQLAHAKQNSAAFADILRDIDVSAINSRAALTRIPVTRKSELLERQKAKRQHDVFGGFSALVRGPAMSRVFASPGPIYEPEGATRDYWRAGRALFAAGFRSGELVHNSFSYHMTPGAFILESGAHAVGCTVFPAGTGQTEQQLEAMVDLKPDAYTGTPSFLRILLEKAKEGGFDIRSLTKASVGGEACPPSLTAWFKERGVDVYQTYATADLGLVAYETTARQGLLLSVVEDLLDHRAELFGNRSDHRIARLGGEGGLIDLDEGHAPAFQIGDKGLEGDAVLPGDHAVRRDVVVVRHVADLRAGARVAPSLRAPAAGSRRAAA